jgi:hypothetical protein
MGRTVLVEMPVKVHDVEVEISCDFVDIGLVWLGHK